jgi:hypothetical protein
LTLLVVANKLISPVDALTVCDGPLSWVVLLDTIKDPVIVAVPVYGKTGAYEADVALEALTAQLDVIAYVPGLRYDAVKALDALTALLADTAQLDVTLYVPGLRNDAVEANELLTACSI